MSRLAEERKRVQKRRSERTAALKSDFLESVTECPCCGSDSRNLNISFWFGNSGFSIEPIKWAVKCQDCELRADFWARKSIVAVRKFREVFQEQVALRLMGKKKKRRKKRT